MNCISCFRKASLRGILYQVACITVPTILLVACTAGLYDYSKLSSIDVISNLKEVKQFSIEEAGENFDFSLLFAASCFFLARHYQPLKLYNFAFVHEIFHLSPLVMSDYHIGRSPPIHS